MAIFSLTLALLLPWLLGAVWLRYRWQPAPQGAWAVVLGYGYIAGIIATTFLMRFWDLLGFHQSFGALALIMVGLIGIGAWLTRDVPWRTWSGVFITPGWHEQQVWQKAVFVLLLTLIAVRFAGLGLEIIWRPLFPWDAWWHWAPRARVWFELKSLVPFADLSTWLKDTSGDVYTISGYSHPATVSLIQTWTALGLGRWDDSLINLPWLQCAIALGLAFYGQARLWGISPLLALAFTYFLLSMPILDTHVALAGYAELWMASIYALAAMAFFHWVRDRSIRQGGLALSLAVACILIKIPGLIWALTFLPALWVTLSARWRLTAISFVLGLAAVVVIAKFSGESISLAWGQVGQIKFHPVWGAFGENWLAFENWHLFWYLAVAVALFSATRLVFSPVLRTAAMLMVTALAFVTSVFFFTDRFSEAVDYTTINRAALHMVPMLAFCCVIALHWRLSPNVD